MSEEKIAAFGQVRSSPPHAWMSDGTRAGTGHHGKARAAGWDARAWPSSDDPIPLNEFLRDLHREKRRAERSRAALSLVVYRFDAADTPEAPQAERFLEVLHQTKRETDILGHVGDDMIAVLCPDTDEDGINAFLRKMEARAGGSPIAAHWATYPDALFESLGSGEPTRAAFQPFLVAEALPARRNGYRLKRSLDVAGALVALVVLSPLMLLVAAAIALTSHGPVIFRQTRLGKDGAPFTFYKFRSMVMDGDDAIHRTFVAHLIAGSESTRNSPAGESAPYKLQSDPRVTRLGRVIRKTSIDELPQLFNVLRDDMSLVGPRPPIPYEAVHYQPWHLRRLLTVKPGITGLWQVDGRSRVTFNEMVRMDLRYIRECSLALDLKIILRTILVVLRCDGAA